jgi:two-component system phosphate regulon sensor histidine kinase PhoR
MGEGVVILDGSNRILMANKALRNSFNSWIGSQKITGQRLEVLFSTSGLLAIIDQIKANGTSEPTEIEFIQSNEKRWVRVSGAKAKADLSEAEDLILLIFYEITQGKEQETIRREFVANVSHELRTPVTIIKGYADTLNQDSETMPAELRMRFLGKLQKNADRMNDLLEDLLSLAKIESTEASTTKEPIGLNALVNHVLSIYSDRFQNHGVDVSLEVPEEEIEVQADRSKLEQVLENLLNNATKYTPYGTTLKIGAQLENKAAILWVEDDGNGVPEEDLPRIFERFYRVEKGRSRNKGGTGLGLSIVKRIAALYDGTVQAENVKGGGLRIQINLPIKD